jgi:hypothetical protein
MSDKKPAVPIGEVLNAIDRKDRGFWSRLTDEQQKSLSFWLLMRYTSGATINTPLSVYLTNETVNLHFMDIPKDHPELRWLLYTVIGEGRSTRRQYQAGPKRNKASKVAQLFMDMNPLLKVDEAQTMVKLYSKSEIEDLAQQHGYTKAEIKQLWK